MLDRSELQDRFQLSQFDSLEEATEAHIDQVAGCTRSHVKVNQETRTQGNSEPLLLYVTSSYQKMIQAETAGMRSSSSVLLPVPSSTAAYDTAMFLGKLEPLVSLLYERKRKNENKTLFQKKR